jgi:hypothetical protein
VDLEDHRCGEGGSDVDTGAVLAWLDPAAGSRWRCQSQQPDPRDALQSDCGEASPRAGLGPRLAGRRASGLSAVPHHVPLP